MMKQSDLVLILCFTIAFVIVIAPIIYGTGKDKLALRQFFRREDGNFFLVCSSKRRWYDYLQNNVVPVLPPNVELCWYKPHCKKPRIVPWLWRSKIFDIPKPYLALVTQSKIVVVSLNDDLQEMKQYTAKDQNTQLRSKDIIERKMASLKQSAEGEEHLQQRL